jgi:signal transduction histidine kinase
LDKLQHGEVIRYVNLDFDDDDNDVPVDTQNLCPEGNCELIFLYPYKMKGEKWLYLVHGVVGSDKIYDELELTEQVALAIGSLFAALFLLVSFLVIRSIYSPLLRLDRWSAALGTDSSDLTVPDLRFHELDSLANRLRYAFERMRASVEKEKLFLRHASHELRTPISILSANVELIDRLTDRPERSETEQASFVRQYHALDDIRQLIETLLWVNRQSENLPKPESIDLRCELDTIVENYRYLLDGSTVSLTVDGSDEVILAPAAAVRMVLSNLLRNAFQYTVDGEVRITLGPEQVRIENANSAELDSDYVAQPDGEYGFGLGLELVALICKRFEWSCTTSELPHGRVTVVRF